ncbi:hypothetical protein, partial [Saccharopolyspora cebuensis]|uniref:hypothetical protein n=1 Tax=Saccharopolyspora cebuensis TaxID=418759 RepID=UPI0031EEFD8B
MSRPLDPAFPLFFGGWSELEVVMAGHTRTVDTGAAVRTAAGRVRKVRRHRPAGQARVHARVKAHRGARRTVEARLRSASDPVRRLEIALGYVKSARAKFRP